MPAKKPTECCQNLDKLAKESIYEACKTECVKDRCCMGDCIGRGFGFIKDGKFDKDSALKSVNTAFAGNAEWIPVSSAKVV